MVEKDKENHKTEFNNIQMVAVKQNNRPNPTAKGTVYIADMYNHITDKYLQIVAATKESLSKKITAAKKKGLLLAGTSTRGKGFYYTKKNGALPKSKPLPRKINCSKKKITRNPEVDEHAAYELYLYATNDSDLYRQQITPINKNLITKKARGIYKTELAVKLAMYLMENAAKKYVKEYGSRGDNWHDMFNVPTRKEAAKKFVQHFENEAGYGNYDNLLPLKYQKNAGVTTKSNATAKDFIKHQRERLAGLSKMFQGKASGAQKRVLESDYTPKDKGRVGYLVQLKIQDGGKVIPINFDGESYLAMDLRKNLLIVGKDSRIVNTKLPPKGQLKYLGEITQIDYITAKQHIEGGQKTRFYHKLGEVTKEKPNLFIDHEGFLIIVAGGYDIWDVGIVN